MQHFIKNSSGTVNLGFLVVRLSFKDLRGHIGRSARILIKHLSMLKFGGESKVNYLDIGFFEHNIG